MADNGGGYDLSDYVDVAERIKEFREKHPGGCFQVRLVALPEAFADKFVAVEATAYRNPEDPRPARDVAWEPVPGKTSFTKDSELMNASTSAVGRAIVYALAADTSRGIASAQEVRNRSGGSSGPIRPSEKQLEFVVRLVKKVGGDVSAQENIRAFVAEHYTGGKEGTCSQVIDSLKGEDAVGVLGLLTTKAGEWTKRSAGDLPAFEEDDPSQSTEPLPF